MSVNGEPIRVSHAFVKKNMVWYMRPQWRFAHCSCKNSERTRGRGWQAKIEGKCCIFTLAVPQPPVLASCIEMYYCNAVLKDQFRAYNFFFKLIFLYKEKNWLNIYFSEKKSQFPNAILPIWLKMKKAIKILENWKKWIFFKYFHTGMFNKPLLFILLDILT